MSNCTDCPTKKRNLLIAFVVLAVSVFLVLDVSLLDYVTDDQYYSIGVSLVYVVAITFVGILSIYGIRFLQAYCTPDGEIYFVIASVLDIFVLIFLIVSMLIEIPDKESLILAVSVLGGLMIVVSLAVQHDYMLNNFFVFKRKSKKK